MNTEYWENIDLFLAGELSKDRLKELFADVNIHQLEADIEMASSIDLAMEVSELQDQISGITDLKKSAKKTKVISIRTWMTGVAAGVAILLGSIFLFRSQDDKDPFAQFQFKEPGLPVVMGTSSQYELDNAMTYFREENYKRAEMEFSTLRDQIKEYSDTLTYFIGVSQYYQEKYQLSTKTLSLMMADGDSSYLDRAQWFLVLNYLKQDNSVLAKNILDQLVLDDAHEFNGFSRKLLLQLE